MKLRRFRGLARTWDTHGRTDPFFGILSDPTKHGGKWGIDEFFASGRAHVDNLFRALHDLRVPFARDSCLDFGCGVGRLTIPLSEHFDRTVGVDIAPSMIERARLLQPNGRHCEFVVNQEPDLARFPPASFDVVHSSLVLQHMSPEIALGYLREFFRVCRPGGLVVFQLPAEARPASLVSELDPLPAEGRHAVITILDPIAALGPSQVCHLRVVVTNSGTVPWRHDIPGGRHLAIGNHWLEEDGRMAIRDDARAYLPRTITPGESIEVRLRVRAPEQPGTYVLEVDAVQELVCWFGDQGSPTARRTVSVSGGSGAMEDASSATADDTPDALPPVKITPRAPSSPSLVQRLRRRFRHREPFEMFTIARVEIEQVIGESGGDLLRAIDDNAAGPAWCSYTYVCRRRTA